jgi:two-component system, OmpR family, response regulator
MTSPPTTAQRPATVLVVDDEANIRDVIEYTLRREGFDVVCVGDGSGALARLAEGGVDLVVLDVLLPDIDGLSLCRRIRERASLPIIFVSSRAEELDRILGLELGGDDYVTKPFSPRELAARVRTVLRRARGANEPEGPVLTHGALLLDVPRHEVRVGETPVPLTVTEFGLLRALLERPGLVLSRAQLVERAYAHDNYITERTIDTHVRRVRQKLRPLGVDPIETVHGVGYRAREA